MTTENTDDQSETQHDGSLLQSVAKGDRTAFEQLFRTYHPRVYSFVIRMLRDRDMADELTCDTLYTVWTDASRFRGESAVSTWILGIAHNKCLKALRGLNRHARRYAPLDDSQDVADDSIDDCPHARLTARMECARVNAAIDRLNADQQVVVRLTALGHSTAEIASIVGCPRNTVKTRMFHARRQLRAHLGMPVDPDP